jgi:phenylpropionate dioxygenase-like ring-hydroxylating dioxygenase large terminal subunit
VTANGLRCPFHGWEYEGGSGRCVHIPTGDPIPPRAQLRSWHVREVSGMVLVWYHDQGAPPSWTIDPLPNFEGSWSSWLEDAWTINATIQDVSENDADVSHSPILHPFTSERPVVEMDVKGAVFTWNIRMKANLSILGIPLDVQVPGGITSLISSRRYGLAIGWITQESPLWGGLTMRTQTLATTTPVDERTVVLRMLHRVHKTPLRPLTQLILRQYSRLFHETVEQDIRIWAHKVYLTRPVASRTDWSVLQFRRWSRQFYSAPPLALVEEAEERLAEPAI